MKGVIGGCNFEIIGRYDCSIEIRIAFSKDMSDFIGDVDSGDFFTKLSSELSDFSADLARLPLVATYKLEEKDVRGGYYCDHIRLANGDGFCSICHERLKKVLCMELVPSYMVTNMPFDKDELFKGYCELEKGHEGPHRSGKFYWKEQENG